MTLFVLPTAEIVWEHKQFESLFCFYDEGIKGIVRDVVLFSSSDWHDEQRAALVDRVIEQYESSIDLRYAENTLSHAYPTFLVELVVEKIRDEVRFMMESLFKRLVYRVEWDNTWDWVGDDLIAPIRLWNEAKCLPNPLSPIHSYSIALKK